MSVIYGLTKRLLAHYAFSSLSLWERVGVKVAALPAPTQWRQRGFSFQPEAQGTLTLALSHRERGQPRAYSLRAKTHSTPPCGTQVVVP